MNNNNIKIIAEGCCNHIGQIDIAKNMIKKAALCNIDYVKWQKRNPIESVPKIWHNNPHPNSVNSFGETYLKHREFLEFTLDQHKELYDFSEEQGVKYSCSVWDMTSAKDIISLNPDFIKIPSPMNNHYNMIQYIYDHYEGDIHISLGMIYNKELDKLNKIIDNYLDRTVVYHTTSEYPVPFENLHMKEILKLKDNYKYVGYSGHNYGIAVDMVAVAYEVDYIERHFTLDRTMKGTDHASSLEITGLNKLVRDVKAVEKSLTYKNLEMTEKELENRNKLKFTN